MNYDSAIKHISSMPPSLLKEVFFQLINIDEEDEHLFRTLEYIVDVIVRTGGLKEIPFLIKLLDYKHPLIPYCATNAILRIGSDTIPFLVKSLENFANSLSLASIIFVLGALHATVAIEVIIDFLHSPRSIIRESAATALGNIGDSRAIVPLMSVIDSNDGVVAACALISLGKIGAQSTLPVLLKNLNEGDVLFQISAAKGLGLLRSSNATASLISKLASSSPDIRFETAVALGNIGDPRAVDALLPIAFNDDSTTYEGEIVSYAAAMACGLINNSWVKDKISKVVEETADERLYRFGMEGVCFWKERWSFDLLITQLKSLDTFRRLYAAQALGRLGYLEAIPILEELVLFDKGYIWDGGTVAEAAANSIARLSLV